MVAGLVLGACLLASWSLSLWLRRQEDFDSPAVDAMTSPTASLLPIPFAAVPSTRF